MSIRSILRLLGDIVRGWSYHYNDGYQKIALDDFSGRFMMQIRTSGILKWVE